MSEFNISALIKTMQVGLAEDNKQEAAGRLLLNSVAQHDLALVDVDGKMVTNLVKRKNDVHEAIRNAAANTDVIAAAVQYFDTEVRPKLNPHTVDDVCLKILNLLEKDTSVPEAKYLSLRDLYNNGKISEFLAMCLLYAVSRPNKLLEVPVDHSDIPLLSEVSNECPLCRSPLVKTIKGNSVRKYGIARIYPEGLEPDQAAEFRAARTPAKRLDSNDNKIALCSDCVEAYEADPELDEYVNLYDLKKEYAHSYAVRQEIAEMGLEDEIRDIVFLLSGLQCTGGLRQLEMGALRIDQKILPENAILKHSIQDDVLTYYRFIEDAFSEIGNFDLIASEIRLTYEKLEVCCATQDEVVNELVAWILRNSNLTAKHLLACRIIVSFFVQNCEVFHEITE